MTLTKGIVLFAHGARSGEWARPIEAMRDAILSQDPLVRVELGFLEFLSPSLGEAIDRLAAAGIRDVVIVPIFMAESGHTKRDLPQLLAAARARNAGMRIDVAAPIGETPAIVRAIADYALALARD